MKLTLNEKNTKLLLNYLDSEFEFSLSELKKSNDFKEHGIINLILDERTNICLSKESFLNNLCHHDSSERGHADDYENERTIYKLYCLLEGQDLDEVEEGLKNLEEQKALLKAKKKEEIDQITAKKVYESLKKEKTNHEIELSMITTKIKDGKKSIDLSEDEKEIKQLTATIASLERDRKYLQDKLSWIAEELPKQELLHEELGVHPTGELSFLVSLEMRKMLVGVRDTEKPGITLKNVTPALIKKEYSEKELQLKLL